jgi:hypothetical protein
MTFTGLGGSLGASMSTGHPFRRFAEMARRIRQSSWR